MFLELAIGVFVILLTRLLWRRWKYDLHKIPTPGGLPFLGQVLMVLGSAGDAEITRVRGRWFRELGYPKMILRTVMNSDLVMVVDMPCVKSVIMSKTDPFPKAQGMARGFALIMGDPSAHEGLLLTPEITPTVKNLRRIYLTAFQSSNLKKLMPKLKGVMDKMSDIIEKERENGPIDFQELCVKMTLDTIGILALDVNLGGLDGTRNLHQRFIDVRDASRERMFNPFKNLYCKLFPTSKAAMERNAVVSAIRAEWDSLTQHVLNRKDPPAGEQPIWYELKKLASPVATNPITYNQLRQEVATLVIAGMDTTGHQLAWILALLASHPRVTENLLDQLEQAGLYGLGSRDVTYEDLGSLPYLAAIIKEGMRIAAALISAALRVAPKDMILLGYRIPKGTLIAMPSNRWLDSEADWGDPQVFRPERWLTDEDMSEKYYLGFSHGPRDCVGQKLAILEMRMAIVHLITKFSLSMTKSWDELMNNCKTGLIVQSLDGICLQVTPRAQKTRQE